MPHLAIGQANNVDILALHAVNSAGYLYDPELVEFIVRDSAGDQLYPAMGRAPGAKVSKGVYKASFTVVDGDYVAGQDHVISWFYSSEDSTTEQQWDQTFGVVAAGLSVPFWTYINPQRLRDEGLTSVKMSDARLISMIKTCQAYIERRCRQPFRPIRAQINVGGISGDTVFLSIPIIGLESVSVYGTEIDRGAFAVFNIPTHETTPGWMPTDNRANPKIKLAEEPTLYGGRMLQRYGRIPYGAKNLSIGGVWGCLDPDGTTPEAIQMAMMYMIMANSSKVPSGTTQTINSGMVQRERTDRHEIEFAVPRVTDMISASPFVKSPEAEEILRTWRGPINIDAPGDWTAALPEYEWEGS